MRIIFDETMLKNLESGQQGSQIISEDVPDLALHLGEQVLLFRINETFVSQCTGVARLVALRFEQGSVFGIVSGVTRIDPHTELPTDLLVRRDGWQGIRDDVFDEIAKQVSATPSGFFETQVEFQHASGRFPPSETLLALSDAVKRNQKNMCALTGQSAASRGQDSESLVIVPVQPVDAGGPVHVQNMLALSPDAADAFTQFHLSVGQNLQIVVDLSRINPELLERLNPLGRLRVSKTISEQPAIEYLSWHWQQFAGRATSVYEV